MDRIFFNQTGGFPLTTNILNALQKAYNLFNPLGNLAGNYTIISGCKETGSNISDGVVFINGEILPFKGGKKISKCRFRELPEKAAFEDGNKKVVVIKRFVEFGTGPDAFAFSKLKRVDTLLIIMERLNALENAPKFVKGMILIWGRPANEIPAGFIPYLELAGRVPVGVDKDYNYYDSDNTDRVNYHLDTVGRKGGEREHILNISELPNLPSNIYGGLRGNGYPDDAGNSGTSPGSWESYAAQTKKISLEDFGAEGKAHKNMQPYRVVEYIQFIGLFRIVFKTLTGTQEPLFCEKTDTVLEIKKRISDDTNIPVGAMNLIYNSTKMKDDKTLEFYNVAYDGVIFLV